MDLVPKPAQKKRLLDASKRYRDQLQASEAHLTYLESRGVTEELRVSFGLGAVIDPVSTDEDYRGRIAFPYITRSGIVTIRFRRLGDGDSAKFLEYPGEIPRLYNVRSLEREDERLFVCEGETDTITAWGAGLAAVGISGATKWGPTFARILRGRDVTVLADNDDSGEGRKFANQIYKDLGGCTIVRMPRGYDVSSYVMKHGKDALLERIHADD